MDGGDGCPTMSMFLPPLNWTVTNGQDGELYVMLFYHTYTQKFSAPFPEERTKKQKKVERTPTPDF